MEGAMEVDMDAPLAQVFKRKRKTRKKESQSPANKSSEAALNSENASFPSVAEPLIAHTQPEILVSEFKYSIEDHFKDVDTIAKLCGYPKTLNADHAEITRLSNSVTFLREWRDFNYAPRVVRFACQHSSKEKDVMGQVTLPQFSAASVPKDLQNGSKAGTESRDFVMNAGGAVWALDWCPRVDGNPGNHIKSEFIAIAAHPPESSYHKIGTPLTGRGAIQIWCLLTNYVKEDVPAQGNKKPRSNTQRKGSLKSIATAKIPRPRGRPRKKPIDDSAEKVDTDSLHVQPLSVEYPGGSPTLHFEDRTSGHTCKHVNKEQNLVIHKNLKHKEHENVLSLTAPKVIQSKAKAGKQDQLHNNGLHILRQCKFGESAIVNSTAPSSFSLDCMSHDNVTCISSFDANTCSNSIPMDVALPKMMLCLAHNGKVAWDVKWKPVSACDPESMNIMGYLAVLLGNGALEVWEVPFPHTAKLLYPANKELTDPRFVKLQPVFRCSMLKCGDRQSIPMTVEWSVSPSPPNDMILVGCHDGVIALWKFYISDSLTETRPLLSFSADTGPIRTLAWAPIQSDLESANVIVTAGHKGFKFWDIRDPFRPLWEYPIQGVTFGLDWLPDPRCVFGSIDDGTLWLLSLERAALDIPITGKSFTVTPKQGFHIFLCSSFSIWNVHTSRLTGMVAYCGEEGTAFCFKPTVKSARDPSRNRMHHYLCGSLLEEEGPALTVATPSTNSSFKKRSPSLKRAGAAREHEKRALAGAAREHERRTTEEQIDKSPTRNEPTLAICYGNYPTKEHMSDKSPGTEDGKQNLSSSKNGSRADQGKVLCMSEDSARKATKEAERRDEEIEAFPPKNVAMHRVRWNVNKGSEKWLCYGGAAGLLRCHEVDFSVLQ